MFLRFSNPFYYPDTPTSAQSGGGTALPEGKEDIIDYLAEDTPPESEKLDLTPPPKKTKDALDDCNDKMQKYCAAVRVPLLFSLVGGATNSISLVMEYCNLPIQIQLKH